MVNPVLGRRQLYVIRKSAELAGVLQRESPEIIVSKRREGKSLSEIAGELNVSEKYSASKKIARSAVGLALRGYNGGMGVEEFDGLISREEASMIAKEVNEESGRESGRKSQEGRTGVFALTHEEKVSFGRESVISRGFVPFKEKSKKLPSEMDYAYELSLKPEYQHGNGCHAGKPNLELIARELNRVFHGGREVRRVASVAGAVRKVKLRIGTIGPRYKNWTEEEKKAVYRLSQQKEYIHGEGFGRGRPDINLIAKEINRRFHKGRQVRSYSSVAIRMGTFRKARGVRIQKPSHYWTEEESKIALELSQLPEFIHSRGNNRGKVNLVLIAERLNKRFHSGGRVITRRMVHGKLKRLRRKERRA